MPLSNLKLFKFWLFVNLSFHYMMYMWTKSDCFCCSGIQHTKYSAVLWTICCMNKPQKLWQLIKNNQRFHVGFVELCAKILQIMRNDFKDYACTFCQLCAPSKTLDFLYCLARSAALTLAHSANVSASLLLSGLFKYLSIDEMLRGMPMLND